MSLEQLSAAIGVGTVVTLVIALLGVWQLAAAWLDPSDIERRSELEKVELEAARARYRANAALVRTRLGRSLGTSISRAGVDLRPLDLLAAHAAAAGGGFLLLFAVGPLYLGVIGAAAGVFGVRQWLESRQRARIEEFVGQLPEFSRTLSNATAAGRSLLSALQLSAGELDEPARTELLLVSEQLRIGSSVDAALASFRERLPSRELSVLVSTLVIQQRTGGDVVAALRDMAETLDARKDLRREVHTIVSGAVQTGYVTGAMGLGLVLLMNLVYPGMIDAMARSFAGQIALAIAASLYLIAFLLVRRMTTIDV